MKKTICLKGVLLVVIFAFFFSCSSSIDINNEEAVMKNIQGTWIGCLNIGKVYRHFKLNVTNNLFEGWVQNTESEDEPNWAAIPDENGFISLSSILTDPEKEIKFRKFALTCEGRCCGDKSFSIKALSQLITYQDDKGLVLDGKVKMLKK